MKPLPECMVLLEALKTAAERAAGKPFSFPRGAGGNPAFEDHLGLRTWHFETAHNFQAHAVASATDSFGCQRPTWKATSPELPSRRKPTSNYFTSARKLGVGSAPMSACLDTAATAPGVPAATLRTGGTWRVTCAVY
jgi:hypothetical protein